MSAGRHPARASIANATRPARGVAPVSNGGKKLTS